MRLPLAHLAPAGGAQPRRDHLRDRSRTRDRARETQLEEYGVEDPRITEIDGVFHITYVSVSRLGITTSRLPTDRLPHVRAARASILHPDQKDVVLFPERVDGRHLAFTRPMPGSFGRVLGIWLARVPRPDPLGGTTARSRSPARACGTRSRIGASLRARSAWTTAGSSSTTAPTARTATGWARCCWMPTIPRWCSRAPTSRCSCPRSTTSTDGFLHDVVFPSGHITLDERARSASTTAPPTRRSPPPTSRIDDIAGPAAAVLRQLARLTRPVPAAGPGALAVAVYADGDDETIAARESGFEGVACVDDAARLLGVLSECATPAPVSSQIAARGPAGCSTSSCGCRSPTADGSTSSTTGTATRNDTGLTSSGRRELLARARACVRSSDAWLDVRRRARGASHRCAGSTRRDEAEAPPDVRALHLEVGLRLIADAGPVRPGVTGHAAWADEIASAS